MSKGSVMAGLAVLSLALGPPTATADEYVGFYAGLGAGTARVDNDAFGIDDNDAAFKVFAGYSLAELVAVELAYMDGGTARDTINLFPGLGIRAKQQTRIVNLSVLGNLPLTERFGLFGKLGLAAIDTAAELRIDLSDLFGPPAPGAGPPVGAIAAGDQIIASDRDTREEVSYGAGAVYTMGERLQLRAEYDGFDVRNGSLSFFSLNALYRFR